jgi:hypothetical protein
VSVKGGADPGFGHGSCRMIGEVARRLIVRATAGAARSPSAAALKALAQPGTCAGRQAFDPRKAVHPAREDFPCGPAGHPDLLCACLRSDRGALCAEVSNVAVRGGRPSAGGGASPRRTARAGRPARSTGWCSMPRRATPAPARASRSALPANSSPPAAPGKGTGRARSAARVRASRSSTASNPPSTMAWRRYRDGNPR